VTAALPLQRRENRPSTYENTLYDRFFLRTSNHLGATTLFSGLHAP
jgi:hypothetical protein